MKKIFTLSLLTALLVQVQAQAQTANAVVYSELGEKFTLYLNSEQQNDQPQSNVKVKGLTADYYQARIDFEDSKLPDFVNNNFAVQKGLEVTYVVKKNKKGEYVLRYHGESPVSGSTATETSTAVNEDVKRISDVHNEPTDVAVKTNTQVGTQQQEGENIDMEISLNAPDMEEVKVKTQVGATTTTTTTNSTTTSKPATTNTENVSMGVNVGGVNMGVNFKVEETTTGDDVNLDMNVNESSTKTTTTTRTTTSGTTAPTKPSTAVKPTTPTKPAPAPAPKPKPEIREEVVVVGAVAGCTIPMSSSDFTKAKTTIAGKTFEDQKLSTAKTIAKANCLSAEQIKDLCNTFTFEDSKLEFAKYAYDYCSDKGNYYLINEVFKFSSSSDELDEFISSK
jgi:hypothetical protein